MTDFEFLSGDSPDTGYNPEKIVKIKSIAEVKDIIAEAKNSHTPICAVSSKGPHYSGISAPMVPGAVMLDFSGMNNIFSISKEQRMAVVEAGVTYEELIPALKAEGLELPISLKPKAGKSVLADVLNQNPRINPTRLWNHIEPLRCSDVVFGDGNYMRTGNSGGPDLAKQQAAGSWQDYCAGPMMIDYERLLTSSLGTLGVSSWVSLRLDLNPVIRKLFFIASEDIKPLIDAMYEMNRIRMTEEIFLINKKAAEFIFDMDFENQPNWLLVVGAAGRELLANMRFEGMVSDIKAIAGKYKLSVEDNYADLSGEYAQAVLLGRENAQYYWKRNHKDHALDIFFTSTADRVDEFNRAVITAVKGAGFDCPAVYVQPQHQGVCCQIEYVVPYSDDQKDAAKELFSRLSITIHHMRGYYARPFNNLWMITSMNENSREYQAMKSVKKIFDPENIMNPGRIYF